MSKAAIRHAKTGPGNGSGFPALSLTYPIALILVAVFIFSFLMYYIVPNYKAIFHGFGTELPEETQLMIFFADVWVQYFYLSALVLLPLLAVGVWVIDAYCRGWGESDVPLVGRWFRRLDMPGVLRNLATTVAANRPLDDTLDLLGKEHPRRAVQVALSKASEQSRKGDDCWYALCDVGLLNVREVAALRSAQRVGNLAWALEQIATTIERQISYRWRTALEVVQPATILGLGLLVGLIEIGFFLPLMGLISDLS
jgi:type IV pilus assembly protein PilC